ncbi:AMP-binding protein [Streptomyces sp. GQFP]|uniref:AMP-binding protein n=1 Tax=Streptomyces sp. GQFP TaxID=2907545 RepID=UPI001F2F3EF8|nr:AMP-binding protein [Streptomyces sp. GQFP]UIX31979.1 AMP-binding protein [Streptomyces sp. GQFP]
MKSWQGIRHLTALDRLDELVKQTPDRVFARFGDWAPNYAEIDARATELAGQLHELGVRAGERVATLSPNRYELLELFVGVARLGAIQVPLNPYLKGEFLSHQLRDSRAATVITDALGWKAVRPLLPELPFVERVVLLDPEELDAPEDRGAAEVPRPGVPVVRYHAMPAGTAPRSDVGPEDTMAIIYTSGTTGQPKGCVLSHGYYTRAGQTLAEMMRLTEEDVFLTPLPLFHGGGQLISIMPSLMAGIPIVVIPVFSASGFFETAARVGATVANAVGAMGAMLLATPEGPFDRAHRLRLFNVSPLASSLHPTFRDRFGVDPWTESYGQTECVFQLLNSPYGERDRDSNGKPLRDLEVELLDDDGHRVPDGTVGEICLRPRHRFAMFDGYWGRPAETVEAFKGMWYHTGDFGMVRESGAIRFVDRKKDALRVRGENVSSIELEVGLARHPQIAEAGVHGVASEMGEDDIKACLVLEPGARVDPAELFAWMRENLPYFAVPRYVEIVETLPKNQVNRIQKHLLRERGLTEGTWDHRALGLVIGRDGRR